MSSPASIFPRCTLSLALRFTISPAGIAGRTLTLMQGSEEKQYKIKNAVRIELECGTSQTNAPTTTSQQRHCRVVKVYLTRVNKKKAIDCESKGTSLKCFPPFQLYLHSGSGSHHNVEAARRRCSRLGNSILYVVINTRNCEMTGITRLEIKLLTN